MNSKVKKLREDLIKIHNKYIPSKIVVDGSSELDLSILFKTSDETIAKKLDPVLKIALSLEGAAEAYESNKPLYAKYIKKLAEELEDKEV